ncbi:outer membrane beta-barrel protein [Sphingomonas sp. MMS12-HWE2-04]|uniref:outer membrane beta-barrel protein n=1 Tax=Sphingomonas sp. MMS12-HWE2-04 TaxID=3234199 RepID=UPI00384D9CCC
MRIVASGAVCSMALALPAHAQNDEKKTPEQGLHIEPSLTAVYDDNVYRVDSAREDPTSDVIVTPQVEVRFTRDNGVRAFTLRGLAGYDRFISESQRSKPRFEAEASGKLLIAGTCSVRPLASYRQQRADYGDINSATENLQRFSTLGVAADCERAAGLYPLAAYRRDTTRNGDGFEYADMTSNLYRAGIGYARPSLGRLTAYYEHNDSDRPEIGVKNRYDAGGVTFDRSVSPITTVSADLRWMHVTSNSGAVGSYDGPGWRVQLATTAIPRLKITGTTDRTVVNDSLVATGFVIRTGYRLGAEYGLSELTSIGAFADFSRRELRQDASIRPFSYTRDRTNQFGALMRRKLTERFALELSLSHYDRSTNSDASHYKATRLSLGATAKF